jgi:hypothetical protein
MRPGLWSGRAHDPRGVKLKDDGADFRSWGSLCPTSSARSAVSRSAVCPPTARRGTRQKIAARAATHRWGLPSELTTVGPGGRSPTCASARARGGRSGRSLSGDARPARGPQRHRLARAGGRHPRHGVEAVEPAPATAAGRGARGITAPRASGPIRLSMAAREGSIRKAASFLRARCPIVRRTVTARAAR